MAERDTSGRADGRRLPIQRRPQGEASLHEILAVTAERARAIASTTVGTTGPRRTAGFMDELIEATKVIATRWGIDPGAIPVQPIREVTVVYQKPGSKQTRQPELPNQVVNEQPSPEPIRDDARPSLALTTIPDTEQITSTASTTDISSKSELISAPPITSISVEAQALQNSPSAGRAIAILLMRQGITQEVIAGHLGVSKSSVDKSLRNQRPLKVGTIHRICDYLGYSETDERRSTLIQMAIEEEREKDRQKLTSPN